MFAPRIRPADRSSGNPHGLAAAFCTVLFPVLVCAGTGAALVTASGTLGVPAIAVNAAASAPLIDLDYTVTVLPRDWAAYVATPFWLSSVESPFWLVIPGEAP